MAHKKAAKRTRKMLVMMRENPTWWARVCTPGTLNAAQMKNAVDLLAKQRFYELIFVLLTVHRGAAFMKNFALGLWLDEMLAHWDEKNAQLVVERMKAWLARPEP